MTMLVPKILSAKSKVQQPILMVVDGFVARGDCAGHDMMKTL